jgi:hypothetical protein
MKQFLKICLWTQVFSLIFALVAFRMLPDPRMAGSMTGPVFLLSGALPFLGILVRRTSFKNFSFWLSLVFTLFFSVPMLWKRFMLYGVDFKDITYYGISSGIFHRLSGFVFLVVMAALIVDLIRLRRQEKASK